jgi:hypothetical protein
MAIGAAVISLVGTALAARESKKAREEQKKEREAQQTALAKEQADIAAQKEAEQAEYAAAEEAARKKKGSRLALISTSPQGVLGSSPIGRRQLLSN